MVEFTGAEAQQLFEKYHNWNKVAAEFGVSRETARQRAKNWRKRREKQQAQADAGTHAAPQFATPPTEPPSLEDLIALARQTQKAVDQIDPILTHETITLPSAGPAAIVFVSCAHLGSRYVNHESFEKLLDEILKIPNLYWCGLGDDTEGFTGFFDVASAHEQALADPKLQRRLLALVLDKLAAAGKLLCGFASQHGSDWVRQRSAEDPIKRLYLDRRVPYFDGQAYITLKVGSQTYKLFGSHKLPGHSMYNKNHPQKRAALFKAPGADVIFMGDAHSYGVQQVGLDTFEWLAGDRPSPYQWYVQVSAAKTGPEPYTIKSYSPALWNWPTLVFRSDRHCIAQAADLDVVRWMLSGW